MRPVGRVAFELADSEDVDGPSIARTVAASAPRCQKETESLGRGTTPRSGTSIPNSSGNEISPSPRVAALARPPGSSPLQVFIPPKRACGAVLHPPRRYLLAVFDDDVYLDAV